MAFPRFVLGLRGIGQLRGGEFPVSTTATPRALLEEVLDPLNGQKLLDELTFLERSLLTGTGLEDDSIV
jgi:hypothetical protein